MTAGKTLWDDEASTYDQEPDHGLGNPETRAAWKMLLETHLPPTPARVLDAGCGTGSLSLLMRESGHDVVGIDSSGAMLERARAKLEAAGQTMPFHLMDAGAPGFPPRSFDVVLSRHVLWIFDVRSVLDRWLSLLRSGGRLLLIEGFWHTGAGLHADDIRSALRGLPGNLQQVELDDDSRFWGGPIRDERYLLVFSPADQISE
jgi:SAM-dependent methyltransferase